MDLYIDKLMSVSLSIKVFHKPHLYYASSGRSEFQEVLPANDFGQEGSKGKKEEGEEKSEKEERDVKWENGERDI